MAVNLAVLSQRNLARWNAAKVTRGGDFRAVAPRLVASDAKRQYIDLQAATRVPWAVIAVIHQRESNQNFARSLAQGDPWSRVSVNVPAGRGPFHSFFDAGIDSLLHCGPYAGRWTDWSIGGALCLLEQYNGLGYAAMNRPSAYIWSGTNQYVSGKYIRDHVYSQSAIDVQLGCAGLLMEMMKLDPSIQFVGASITVVPTVVVPSTPKPVPSIPQPAHVSWFAWLLKFLFKK